MKHLQNLHLFEEFSSTDSVSSENAVILEMLKEATGNFNPSGFKNWDEGKIRDAFLMMKTPMQVDAIDKALNTPQYLGKKVYSNQWSGKSEPYYPYLHGIFWTAFVDSGGWAYINPVQRMGGDQKMMDEILEHLIKIGYLKDNINDRDGYDRFVMWTSLGC